VLHKSSPLAAACDHAEAVIVMILFNKPYGVLCQFTDEGGRPTLSRYIQQTDVYAAGRLDLDSEGLLLLTADGALAHRLTDPRHKQPKTYLVQVDGLPSETALANLRGGVALNDGPTLPARVRAIDGPPDSLWPRDPPVRFRRNLPTSWLEITIHEGRNRQVRRMTAAVGLPTLRLVRTRVGDHQLGALSPGQTRIVDQLELPR